ncbi:MAG: metallophosphoesterase family protein [Mariprofundales bacterium]
MNRSQQIILPVETRNWLECGKHGLRQRKTSHEKSRQAVKDLLRQQPPWQWPQRPTVFISDIHADADALLASLVACGAIKKRGRGDHQFKLTAQGREMCFVFGGDFFDKEPGNLRLLRLVRNFLDRGARLRLLAGNHDLRVLFGMRSVGNSADPCNGHFFVRMGAKAIPLLCEIRDGYLDSKHALRSIPSREQCRERLFPAPIWWQQFPQLASWVMPPQAIDREMRKVRDKVANFEQQCAKAGLSLQQVYAAALKWQQLFLHEAGEFHWFFDRLRLAYRKGSFLFVHAGIDDRIAAMLKETDTRCINRLFHQQIQGSPFEFYYGPVANIVRTKYRNVDMPLTRSGARLMHEAGVYAVVHGHRNLCHGQRIALRQQVLHFECDVTLDCGSRRKEGLHGAGAGATIIHPNGEVLGISSDDDKIKRFQPTAMMEDP